SSVVTMAETAVAAHGQRSPSRRAPTLGERYCFAFLHELPERRLVADRIEVRILGGVRAELVEPLDREPEVLDGIVLSAGQALAAREVVERRRVVAVRRHELAAALDALAVLLVVVDVRQRLPDVPAP